MKDGSTFLQLNLLIFYLYVFCFKNLFLSLTAFYLNVNEYVI